ncbi:MAG TPA: hypothetical protein VKB46_09515 [Pyrinomonadaceae bacterium]|nr:hypothetical protein [Pyrinomonadaceae bacterium]
MTLLQRRGDALAVFDYVKIASIAFWDAYLKNDRTAKAYLKSNSLVSYSNNLLSIDRK